MAQYMHASFLRTGAGIQTMLKFSLRNSRGCNVVITDGRYA
jgi:hypothetical protein